MKLSTPIECRPWMADLTDELIALRRHDLHFDDAWSLAVQKYPRLEGVDFRRASKRKPGHVPGPKESVATFVRRQLEAAYYREEAESPRRAA